MFERIEINLLPAEYRIHRRAFRVQREVLYPLLFAAAACAVAWTMTLTLDNRIRAARDAIGLLDVQIEQSGHVEHDLNTLAADKKLIGEKIVALEQISVNRTRWVRYLETFCRCLPEYSWLVGIAETDSSALSLAIEGRTYSFPAVAAYMSRLKSSVGIAGVDLVSIEQIDDKNRLFSFRLTCIVDPHAGMAGQGGEPARGEGP